ncbi:MAG: TolC family protein [Gemmatimonadota bacterium]|nr:TolC family protein [Gemmatimonadota bacterium]
MRYRYTIGLAAGALALSLPAEAQSIDTDTLRLIDAISIAVEANPALVATRLRADAAMERVRPAGALPDPQLMFGLMNRPVNGFGTDQPMTMNTIQVSQRIPWPGKLRFASEGMEEYAEAFRWDASEAELQLSSNVTGRYLRIAFLDRAVLIMRETKGLLEDFLEVANANYSVGTGIQQDVLQAQVTIAQIEESITTMEQERIAAAARLNGLLGRDATEPVPALELHEIGDQLPAPDSLMILALSNRPAFHAEESRIAAAERSVSSAGRAAYPDLMITLGYGQRPQFDDMATVMVGMSLPLWAGKRYAPRTREMTAMLNAAQSQEENLRTETYAQIVEQHASAERARRLATLYSTSILPQATASVSAALSSYRVGRTDYMTLVQSQLTVNRYETEAVRLRTEYRQAIANLEALVGISLEEIR